MHKAPGLFRYGASFLKIASLLQRRFVRLWSKLQHLLATYNGPLRRPSSFGLGMSDEQQTQLELERPPDQEDFADFPDAPTLHRFRHVNHNHITDDTDPNRVPTNTGRCAMPCSYWPSQDDLCNHRNNAAHQHGSAGVYTLKAVCSKVKQCFGLKGSAANQQACLKDNEESHPSLCKGASPGPLS